MCLFGHATSSVLLSAVVAFVSREVVLKTSKGERSTIVFTARSCVDYASSFHEYEHVFFLHDERAVFDEFFTVRTASVVQTRIELMTIKVKKKKNF